MQLAFTIQAALVSLGVFIAGVRLEGLDFKVALLTILSFVMSFVLLPIGVMTLYEVILFRRIDDDGILKDMPPGG